MLINDIDIAHFLTHAQQIEEAKLKGRDKDINRFRNDDHSSHARTDGHGYSKNQQRFFRQY